MLKKIILKLRSIKYAGDSIGDDIHLEIEISGKSFTVDQNIEPGTTFEFNREIIELSDNGILEIPIRIKIVEQDILFDDIGETSGALHIDTANLPQTFNFEIKVQERGTNFRKATAVFIITLEARIISTPALTGRVALYPDIEQTDFARLRAGAKTSTPEIAKLKNGDIVEVVERIVNGEHIAYKSDIWHKVKYQTLTGFILSTFLEIEGEEREKIIFKINEEAKRRGVDPDFALALAGCESHYKPYAVSNTGARGIFQLTGIARRHLHEKLNFDISDNEAFEPDKNITAGLIYLNWLLNIYKGKQDEYKKVVAAWNAGHSLIPANGPISFEHIKNITKKNEVKNLVNCVGKNRKNKNWQNIVVTMAFVATLGLGARAFYPAFLNHAISLEANIMGTQNSDSTKFEFQYPDLGIKKIEVTDHFDESTDWTTHVEFVLSDKTFHKEYSGGLYNAYFFNGMEFGWPQLVVIRGEGQSILTSMLEFNDHEKTLTGVDFIDKDGNRSDTLCCNYMLRFPTKNGVSYDIGMPDFTTGHAVVTRYDYDSIQNAFIEHKH